MTAKNRLFVTRLTSIGAVGDGDNPPAEILLYKSRPTPTTIPEDEPGQGLPIVEKHMADLDLSTLADDVRVEVEKAISDRDDQIMKLEAAALVAADEDVDDVLKSLPDEAQARFAELEKSNQETVVLLAKERDARLTAEWVGKARNYTIVGDAEDAGPHLKTLVETDSAEWLLKKLDEWEAIVAKSDLFKELGKTDGGTAFEQITALAKEAQKDNSDLTDAQARALVRKGNPELKAAEREEAK